MQKWNWCCLCSVVAWLEWPFYLVEGPLKIKQKFERGPAVHVFRAWICGPSRALLGRAKPGPAWDVWKPKAMSSGRGFSSNFLEQQGHHSVDGIFNLNHISDILPFLNIFTCSKRKLIGKMACKLAHIHSPTPLYLNNEKWHELILLGAHWCIECILSTSFWVYDLFQFV